MLAITWGGMLMNDLLKRLITLSNRVSTDSHVGEQALIETLTEACERIQVLEGQVASYKSSVEALERMRND